jgi:hypothetical protein
MPNQRDIRLLCKPLVERRDDLICANRYLLFVPLRSFFAGLCFQRSSYHDPLEPTPIVTALCSLRPEWPFAGEFPFMRPGTKTWREANVEDHVFNKALLDQIKPEWWLMSDADYPQAVRVAIEQEMLPQIAELVSWNKALEFEVGEHSLGDADYAQIALPYLLALGDFERAKLALDVGPLCELILRQVDKTDSGLGDRLARQGDKLSMEDKRALIAILHEREAAAIRFMKLEKYWQPTPFPAEAKGLV